jgi:DNA topoisomerase-2
VIQDFYSLRIEYYAKRKDYLAGKLGSELTRLENKVRFILMVVNGELIVANRKKADLVANLEQLKFERMSKSESKSKSGAPKKEEELDDEDEEDSATSSAKGSSAAGYDYLLGMPLWSLTKEKVDELCKEKDDKMAELDWLLSQSSEDLWNTDLDAFSAALEQFEADEKAAVLEAMKINKTGKKGKPVGKAKSKKRLDSDEEDEDDDFEDDESDDDWGGGKKKTAAAKKEKTAPARATSRPAPKKAEAAAPAATAAPKAAPWLAPKPAPVQDDENLSLMERLKRKQAAAGVGVFSSFAAPGTSKAASKEVVELSDGNDDEASDVPKSKPKPRARAATKKAVISDDEEDPFDFEDGDDDDFDAPKSKAKAAPKPKAAAKPKAAPKKRPECSPAHVSSQSIMEESPTVKVQPKKQKTQAEIKPKAAPKRAPKKKVDSDDDDEDIFEPEKTSTPVAPRAGGRARAPVTYKLDPDSEDDASECSEFNDESD